MKKCANCENLISQESIYCQNCEKDLPNMANGEYKHKVNMEENSFANGLPTWDIVPPEAVVVRRKRKI
ncbi:hypothetical protein BCR22_11225 [Enterococcus plantarum]|uniref:hypothetical protein n=1 Tax=Enterococcus plantarum TaxID=1077675 RepID=UPI00084D76DD|nr:hypothetical protein [Enterococcus plantarum]OEG18217.1 hypothetical protein BCR22_11225 [Enterococcus plantarum]